MTDFLAPLACLSTTSRFSRTRTGSLCCTLPRAPRPYDRVGHCTEITVTVNDGHTGTATRTGKARCPVCGTVCGEVDENNHAGLKRVAAKAATKSAEGNIEYWYCADCGKYFSDASAAHEITQADTVTAKLPADAKTPTTGDSAAVVLWVALLLLSSGAVAVAVTLRRKNRG